MSFLTSVIGRSLACLISRWTQVAEVSPTVWGVALHRSSIRFGSFAALVEPSSPRSDRALFLSRRRIPFSFYIDGRERGKWVSFPEREGCCAFEARSDIFLFVLFLVIFWSKIEAIRSDFYVCLLPNQVMLEELLNLSLSFPFRPVVGRRELLNLVLYLYDLFYLIS